MFKLFHNERSIEELDDELKTKNKDLNKLVSMKILLFKLIRIGMHKN